MDLVKRGKVFFNLLKIRSSETEAFLKWPIQNISKITWRFNGLKLETWTFPQFLGTLCGITIEGLSVQIVYWSKVFWRKKKLCSKYVHCFQYNLVFSTHFFKGKMLFFERTRGNIVFSHFWTMAFFTNNPSISFLKSKKKLMVKDRKSSSKIEWTWYELGWVLKYEWTSYF